MPIAPFVAASLVHGAPTGAESAFKCVLAAYEVLKDPKRRATYKPSPHAKGGMKTPPPHETPRPNMRSHSNLDPKSQKSKKSSESSSSHDSFPWRRELQNLRDLCKQHQELAQRAAIEREAALRVWHLTKPFLHACLLS